MKTKSSTYLKDHENILKHFIEWSIQDLSGALKDFYSNPSKNDGKTKFHPPSVDIEEYPNDLRPLIEFFSLEENFKKLKLDWIDKYATKKWEPQRKVIHFLETFGSWSGLKSYHSGPGFDIEKHLLEFNNKLNAGPNEIALVPIFCPRFSHNVSGHLPIKIGPYVELTSFREAEIEWIKTQTGYMPNEAEARYGPVWLKITKPEKKVSVEEFNFGITKSISKLEVALMTYGEDSLYIPYRLIGHESCWAPFHSETALLPKIFNPPENSAFFDERLFKNVRSILDNLDEKLISQFTITASRLGSAKTRESILDKALDLAIAMEGLFVPSHIPGPPLGGENPT